MLIHIIVLYLFRYNNHNYSSAAVWHLKKVSFEFITCCMSSVWLLKSPNIWRKKVTGDGYWISTGAAKQMGRTKSSPLPGALWLPWFSVGPLQSRFQSVAVKQREVGGHRALLVLNLRLLSPLCPISHTQSWVSQVLQPCSWALIPSWQSDGPSSLLATDPIRWPLALVEGLSWLHGEWIQAREGEHSFGNQGLPVLSLTQELQFWFPAAAIQAAAPPQAQHQVQEERFLLLSSCWAHSTGLQTWALNCSLNRLQIMLLYRTNGIFVFFGFTVHSSSSDQWSGTWLC